MKKSILPALIAIALAPAALHAQRADREEVARQVDRYIRTVSEAADAFLDRNLSPGERVRAIEPHATIYDARQVEQFKNVVLDAREAPEVRAAALPRIAQHVAGDERIATLVMQWLADPRTPRPLREAALETEVSLSFMFMNVPEVYHKMLQDPERAFRVFAFTRLIVHGDPRAQQLLIRGLESPGEALLPAPTAIGILSMAPKKEFYPAVFGLIRTDDPATRLEAIRVLGQYPEARQALIAIAHDPGEKPEFREAALGALYAGDRENIIRYVTTILEEPNAPPRLQAIGIRMTRDVRQAMSYRVKATKADAYDRLVARLARESRDPDVRTVASGYIEAVRPRF